MTFPAPGDQIAHMIIDMAASSAAAEDMGVNGAEGLELAGNHALDENDLRRRIEAGELTITDAFMPPAILLGWLVWRLERHGEDRAAIYSELRALVDGNV